jgi:hypothetical protein
MGRYMGMYGGNHREESYMWNESQSLLPTNENLTLDKGRDGNLFHDRELDEKWNETGLIQLWMRKQIACG